MKTPKEILLQRHEAMESKLNAVRHRALAPLSRPGWGEFLFSMRWHLAGLSAVWMVILFLNFDAAASPEMVVARARIPTAQVLLEALLKNRRELIQLTESPAATEPEALPPRRSQNASATEMA